jgi:hypothetical protein
MNKHIVRILWNVGDILAAKNTLSECLVSADVGSSSKERLAIRCEIVKTRLISLATQQRAFPHIISITR